MRYLIADGCTFEWTEKGNCLTMESLYRISKDQALYYVRPHLLKIPSPELMKVNLGNASYIIFNVDAEFEIPYNHFRKFLIIETDDFTKLYFRFYDPRVLRIFLPTCSDNQLEEFFGPVDRFICEDEDADFALVFSLSKGKLITEKTKWNIFFPIWGPNENQASLTGHLPPNSVEDPPIQSAPEEKKLGRRFIY